MLPEVKISTHFWLPPEDQRHPTVNDENGARWDGTIYVPSLPLQVVIDPGISDNMAVIWTQPDFANGEFRIVDFVQTQDRAIDWLVPFLTGQIPDETYRGEPWPHAYNNVEKAIIARHALWLTPEEIFGDAYGSTRSMATG